MPHYTRCGQCGTRDCEARIIVFADPVVYERDYPSAARRIRLKNLTENGSSNLPLVATQWGPLLCISDVGACKEHMKTAQIAAAAAPDWCHVHIDLGPEPNGGKVLVQVASDLKPADGKPLIVLT